MNRRGQTGIVTYFFFLVIFVINWALWLGRFISEVSARAVTDNSLTGIEAFLLMNINLMIFFTLLIASSVIVSFGAGQ